MRMASVTAIAASVVLLNGCVATTAPPVDEVTHWNAVVSMSLSSGMIYARAQSCDPAQPITAFTLGPRFNRAGQQTYSINPDTDASIRLGSFEDVRAMVVDGHSRLSVTGVDEPFIPLDLSVNLLDQMVDNQTIEGPNYLIGDPRLAYIVDEYLEWQRVLLLTCGPSDRPDTTSESD